jgi:hypothetical protein
VRFGRPVSDRDASYAKRATHALCEEDHARPVATGVSRPPTCILVSGCRAKTLDSEDLLDSCVPFERRDHVRRFHSLSGYQEMGADAKGTRGASLCRIASSPRDIRAPRIDVNIFADIKQGGTVLRMPAFRPFDL